MSDIRKLIQYEDECLLLMLCERIAKRFALLKALRILDDLGVREELVPIPDPDREECQEGVIRISLSHCLRTLAGLQPFVFTRRSEKKEIFYQWLDQMLQEIPWQFDWIREDLFALVSAGILHHPGSFNAVFHIIETCQQRIEQSTGAHISFVRERNEYLFEQAKKSVEGLIDSYRGRDTQLGAEFIQVARRWSDHINPVINELAKQIVTIS